MVKKLEILVCKSWFFVRLIASWHMNIIDFDLQDVRMSKPYYAGQSVCVAGCAHRCRRSCHKDVCHGEKIVTVHTMIPAVWERSPEYSLVQWNWFSNATGCTRISCIQWRQRTNFTAPGCTYDLQMICTHIIDPLRIDVTVTAKWPLWVLRNVTPFTPSHFRQSSEQFFRVSFRFFSKQFFGICFQCLVNNISEKLNIFWAFSWPIPPRKCWYSHRGATLAPPTMRELRTSLPLLPRSLARIFNASHVLMTGLQHDRDAWTGRWVPCNSMNSAHWLAGLVPAELHVHREWLKTLRNFGSLQKACGQSTEFKLSSFCCFPGCSSFGKFHDGK